MDRDTAAVIEKKGYEMTFDDIVKDTKNLTYEELVKKNKSIERTLVYKSRDYDVLHQAWVDIEKGDFGFIDQEGEELLKLRIANKIDDLDDELRGLNDELQRVKMCLRLYDLESILK